MRANVWKDLCPCRYCTDQAYVFGVMLGYVVFSFLFSFPIFKCFLGDFIRGSLQMWNIMYRTRYQDFTILKYDRKSTLGRYPNLGP